MNEIQPDFRIYLHIPCRDYLCIYELQDKFKNEIIRCSTTISSPFEKRDLIKTQRIQFRATFS